MENADISGDFDFYMDNEYSTQLLTPPESQANSQGDGDEHSQDTVSISTSFFPDAHVFGSASDLILLATDSVYFYVHSHILLGVSQNGFNSMLPVSSPEGGDYFVAGPILPVSECASVLNIVLHTIYHTSFSQYSPSFNTLVEATSALKRYGVALESVITPSAPLYDILLTHAAAYPLDLFALAAENGLDDLAVATSNHLLSISLSTISDEMAVRIGPIFLKRLFFMHLGRSEVLRSILLPPPYPHTPTATCGSIQQTKLIRAWTLASAYLAWDARADLSIASMESALSPLGDHLSCELCRTALSERIQILITRWSLIKRTI